MSHAFSQVDVFSAAPLLGNPVAVVHGADDLIDEQMAAFARWTNLSARRVRPGSSCRSVASAWST